MAGDSNWGKVSLFLPLNGNNGSTDIQDYSPTTKAITLSGGAQISTAQTRFSGASMVLDGTGDYLTISDSADFNFGAGDFTIEGSFRLTAIATDNNAIWSTGKATAPFLSTRIEVTYAGELSAFVSTNVGVSSNHSLYSLPGAIVINTWYDVALVRSGGTLSMYLNGTLVEADVTLGTEIVHYTAATPTIGYALDSATGESAGYFSNFRVTKGYARTIEALTAPFIAGAVAPAATMGDSNWDSVVLSLPFDGPNASTDIRDRSDTRKTITVVGNAKISTAQSKFNGASLVLDGSGDYLTIPDSASVELGASDFTIETWVRFAGYPADNGGQFQSTLVSKDVNGSRGFNFHVAGTASSITTLGFIGFSNNTTYTIVSASTTFNLDQWYHVAVVRSGNLVYLFKDGVILNGGGTAFSTTIQNTTTTLKVGADEFDATYKYYLNGYLDDLRVTTGVARYTTSFSVPTVPNAIGLPTPDDDYYGNVTLLINADSGTITDQSPLAHTITASGQAAATQIESKVGAGSLVFDGTSDFLSIPDHEGLNFGTGDFTIECWCKPTSFAANRDILAHRNSADVNNFFYIRQKVTTGKIEVYAKTSGTEITWVTSNTGLTLNTFNHVQVTRVSGVVNIYVNGANSDTVTTNLTSAWPNVAYPLIIGATDNGGTNSYLGHIDGLRITKGVARNTTNFTAPNYIPSATYPTLSLAAPVSLTVYENHTLSIPISLDVIDVYSLAMPVSLSVYESYTIGIPVTLDVNDPVLLLVPISLQVYEIYTLGIPISVSVQDILTLVIPITLTTESANYRLTAPISMQVYENHTIAVPISLQVRATQLTLSVPVSLNVYETLALSVPIRLEVYPVFASGTGGQAVGKVIQLPTTRNQLWSAKVLLNGSDVSTRLTGTISIDKEEGAAVAAVFSLRPAAGQVNPYSWVKASVEILYHDNTSGVDILMFKGVVDTPVVNATTRIVEFTCTDDLQNRVGKMTRSAINAITPLAKWSKFAFEETAKPWDYLQDRLSTYPYAVRLDLNGVLQAYEWKTSTILYEFTEHTILDGSLSPTLANTREITNYYTVSLDSQYEQFRETVARIHWVDQQFDQVYPNWWPCSAQMPLDAISGAGATLVKDPLFTIQGQSQDVSPFGSTQHWVRLNPGADLTLVSFLGAFSKRFTNTVTHSHKVIVQDSLSVSQMGVLEDELTASVPVEYTPALSEAFNASATRTRWLCSAGTGYQAPRTSPGQMAGDPLLAVTDGDLSGWIPYPTYSINYPVWDASGTVLDGVTGTKYLVLDDGTLQLVSNDAAPGGSAGGEYVYDFDGFVVSGTTAERTAAREALVAKAKQAILASHRQNQLAFSTFMNPHIERGQTLRVNTAVVKATGVVYQVTHNLDIDRGTAITNITLALSASKAIGIPDGNTTNIRLEIPISLAVVTDTANSLTVNRTHISYNLELDTDYTGQGSDSYTFDGFHWGGYFTKTTAAGKQEFVVEFPALSEDNTNNTTILVQDEVINVNVPNDEFILTL